MFSEMELKEIIYAVRTCNAKEYAKGTRERIISKCKQALSEFEDTTDKEFTMYHPEDHSELM